MRKINLCAKLCAIALSVILSLSLSACLEKPSEDEGAGQNAPAVDDFSPAIDNGESSELGKEYKKYSDIASIELGFLTLESECFEYEEIEGGVKITKYNGEHEVFAVPDSIDGKAVVAIGREAFATNRWLTAIILPDSVQNIESLAFYGCTNLCYIDLGSGEKTVENYAFSNCPSLYGIDLSSCVKIGAGSFFGCRSLNFIKLSFVGGTRDENTYLGYIFGADSPEHNGEMVPDSLRRVILADGCTAIPDIAFANCEYITSVIISDTVTSIGVRAFYKCRSLAEIDTGDGVKNIGDDAFFYCDSLRTVELSDLLEGLGMQAFFGCAALSEINLPASLEEIKPSTFYGCKSLENVDLTNVKTIGKDAFYGSQVSLETEDAVK